MFPNRACSCSSPSHIRPYRYGRANLLAGIMTVLLAREYLTRVGGMFDEFYTLLMMSIALFNDLTRLFG